MRLGEGVWDGPPAPAVGEPASSRSSRWQRAPGVVLSESVHAQLPPPREARAATFPASTGRLGTLSRRRSVIREGPKTTRRFKLDSKGSRS